MQKQSDEDRTFISVIVGVVLGIILGLFLVCDCGCAASRKAADFANPESAGRDIKK